MSNFIDDLDRKYEIEYLRNGIRKENKNFVCNIPCSIEIYGKKNENYIIRKEKKRTKFLYVKDNCRVYFTDADILTMLLQIKEKNTMDLLVRNLENAYKNCIEKYNILIEDNKYEVLGILQVEDEQILTNVQDIDITFNELMVLINLILSKDLASNALWEGKINFFKHTVSKYISLIKYYYYQDIKAEKYLLDMGYNTKVDIYSNYDIPNKRDEKRGFFYQFEVFEESGII